MRSIWGVSDIDPTYLVNFGFAALVAGFVLVRLESALTNLTNTLNAQTKELSSNDISMREAIKENTSTVARLADAINRAIVTRPPTGPAV